LPLDSHWKLQFSNPEKGPKSEENDPPLSEGWLWACIFTLSSSFYFSKIADIRERANTNMRQWYRSAV